MTLLERYDLARRSEKIVTIITLLDSTWTSGELQTFGLSLRPMTTVASHVSHPRVLLLRGEYEREQIAQLLTRPFDVTYVTGLDNSSLPFPAAGL